jgi:hypothetical protein
VKVCKAICADTGCPSGISNSGEKKWIHIFVNFKLKVPQSHIPVICNACYFQGSQVFWICHGIWSLDLWSLMWASVYIWFLTSLACLILLRIKLCSWVFSNYFRITCAWWQAWNKSCLWWHIFSLFNLYG